MESEGILDEAAPFDFKAVAAYLAQHGQRPEVVYVHPRVFQRIKDSVRYGQRVGPRVAQLTEKQRARLVTRYSNGRHHRKRGRK